MKLKYSLILLASAAFASCQDFLDRYPLEEPASSEFYSNEDELTLAVNGAYRSLYWLSNDDVPYPVSYTHLFRSYLPSRSCNKYHYVLSRNSLRSPAAIQSPIPGKHGYISALSRV